MRRLDCVRNLDTHRYVRHYTRASRGLVDMKPLKQIIFDPHFEREIKLVRL